MPDLTARNEGKACDAILRHIEQREGHQRADVTFPEKEHHVGPVEIVCRIGSERYALEHTRIEPFAGHLQMNQEAGRYIDPLMRMVEGRLPPDDRFELRIPAGALLGLSDKKVLPIHKALAAWIVATAPTLPVLPPYRYGRTVESHTVTGVPFQVSLHRWRRELHRAAVEVVHQVSELERSRLDRIGVAYHRKCDKLSKWGDFGSKTVLIFEENDIQLSNHFLILDALLQVEEKSDFHPNSIYLVSTFLKSHWYVMPLRVDKMTLYDIPIEDRYWTMSPDGLDDITGSSWHER